MASRDTNFYYSFIALPAPKRHAIVAVWDFCRAVDDAVDEMASDVAGAEAAAGELARWREELAACYGSGEPATTQGQHLRPFIRQFNLPRQPFEDLIDGVEMDLGERRYPTFDQLHQYCLRVASAVGLVCVEIFGYQDPRCRQYAVDLGVALQLTNIIRDVAPDLAKGRLYLPLEDLARANCTEEALRAGQLTGPVKDLLRQQCERARGYYARAEAGLPRRDARRLVAARIMGAIYFEILRTVERRGSDVFSRVARVSRPRRAAIAARTWARTMVGF
jgi:15-cis-phytoene synthase